jgi:alcohol sulfotransferase
MILWYYLYFIAGVIGDWKNHFTVAESEHFDALLKTMMKEEDLNFIFE